MFREGRGSVTLPFQGAQTDISFYVIAGCVYVLGAWRGDEYTPAERMQGSAAARRAVEQQLQAEQQRSVS